MCVTHRCRANGRNLMMCCLITAGSLLLLTVLVGLCLFLKPDCNLMHACLFRKLSVQALSVLHVTLTVFSSSGMQATCETHNKNHTKNQTHKQTRQVIAHLSSLCAARSSDRSPSKLLMRLASASTAAVGSTRPPQHFHSKNQTPQAICTAGLAHLSSLCAARSSDRSPSKLLMRLASASTAAVASTRPPQHFHSKHQTQQAIYTADLAHLSSLCAARSSDRSPSKLLMRLASASTAAVANTRPPDRSAGRRPSRVRCWSWPEVSRMSVGTCRHQHPVSALAC